MTKNIVVTVLVALVVSVIAGLFFVGKSSQSTSNENVGGLSEMDIQAVSLKVGATGTKINQANEGTCYFRPSAATIAATSSVKVTCQGTAAQSASGPSALAGVKSGDRVWVQMSTTTSGVSGAGSGLVLNGASASTTNGYIELFITNLTGGTYTWPTTGTATGTAQYRASR